MLFSKFSPYILAVATTIFLDVAFAKYPITGVHTGVDATTGYRPPRRDINELALDTAEFSLYIQALNSMMNIDEHELTSYFQIGGIHGRPFVAWDDVNPTTPADGIPIGYCTHGNILFGTWHRPYLALLEQVMAEHAQKVAKTYNSTAFQTAADNLRMPFWDWAVPNSRFPEIMKTPTVEITTPTGVANVTNPLFNYKFLNHPEPEEWFPTTEGAGDASLGSKPWTLRNPDSNDVQRDQLTDQILAEDGSFLTSAVWDVFSQTKDFNSMSTNGNGGPTFENPHGTIHGFVGGNGHMTSISFSGFEPTFWLHHANVDRQVAMWQAIYPDAWLTPEKSPGGTWTIFPNTVVDETTPLTPFTTGDGSTPYTSITARYTKSFGYSYPDVKEWLFTDPAALAANVTTRVNQLYNPDGSLGPFGGSAASKRSMRFPSGVLDKRDETRAWSVSIKVPNTAVDQAFSVKISAGDIHVGRLSILSIPKKVEVDAGTNKVTHGQFSLVKALGGVDPSDIKAVVAHLKGNLKWSVVKFDGTVVNDVKGLEIEVAEEVVKKADGISKFPVYGQRTVHPEVLA